MEEWAHAYEAKGEARGEGLALQKQLTKRFGVIPADVLAKIAGASTEQIDIWLYQILDAKSLDDLFGPTAH